MKIPSKPSSRKGFTLIELLVVIAIIAVLAAAGFAVGPAMMNRAKKVSAQAVATSLAGGVEQFYTEYSALPDVGDGDGVLTTGAGGSGIELLNILAGVGPAAEIENPRKNRFFTAKNAKGTRDGAVFSGTGAFTALYDPWGGTYNIVLDTDYDDELTVPMSSAPLRNRKVAVYSLGVAPGEQSSTSTLVKSW
jgi:prepilin-type N-terminal cleavage/methylation domain-containing protein